MLLIVSFALGSLIRTWWSLRILCVRAVWHFTYNSVGYVAYGDHNFYKSGFHMVLLLYTVPLFKS